MEPEDTRAPHEEPQEDIDFEPEDELGSLGAASAKLKKLRAELEKAKAERQEYLDGWQRCKADSANQRKDMHESALRTAARGKEDLIEDIIPALDSFDMAAQSEQWASVGDGFRTGMEQVKNQLVDILARHGAERYGKIGEMFDPRLHDAVQELSDVAGEPGSIVRILRFGYRAGERVIRPAQVIIKKHG
jgi:molecular chaperone GrpE